MQYAINEESVPIIYVAKYREFVIRILDGGTSYIVLLFCPWCGNKLPESLRNMWFQELEWRSGWRERTSDIISLNALLSRRFLGTRVNGCKRVLGNRRQVAESRIRRGREICCGPGTGWR